MKVPWREIHWFSVRLVCFNDIMLSLLIHLGVFLLGSLTVAPLVVDQVLFQGKGTATVLTHMVLFHMGLGAYY